MYPFLGEWVAADLHRHALAYNFPSVGAAAAAADGPLGQTFRPVRVESTDAIASALYSRKGKIHMRMYEYRGKEGTASLGYAAGSARGVQVDLAGHDLEPSPDVLAIGPWQIKTIKFEQPVE